MEKQIREFLVKRGCYASWYQDELVKIIREWEQSRQAAVTPALPPFEIEYVEAIHGKYGSMPAHWIATLKGHPGIVVVGETMEKAFDELLKSIRLQFLEDHKSLHGGNAG